MHHQQKSRHSDLLRALIIAVICIIVLLSILIGYLMRSSRKEKPDLTFPYSMNNADAMSTDAKEAEGFASSLVTTAENSVPSGKFKFRSSKEKGLLFCLDEKKAVFGTGIYDRVYPASITKLMTALLAAESDRMDEKVTITAEDVNLGSDSQMSGLKEGDVVTMQQLFSALLVYSANDAAMAIARTIGNGDVQQFVNQMNERAAQLGMTDTHFVNPHGLHDDNHYTSPYDIYLMLNEVAKHGEITDVMKNSTYRLVSVTANGKKRILNLSATDKYLNGEHNLPDGVTILAGKTGTTTQAGNCLALATQNRYGVLYIAVIMNAPNKDILYSDMDSLLNRTNQ